MKMYSNPEQLPSPEQLAQWQATLLALKQEMLPYIISLSMEERQGKRKMGPRRLAYAQNAERRGVLHEDVMPRMFYADNFSRTFAAHNEFSKIIAQNSEIHEMLDDTLMALGIDAMTYTKLVHDGLRSANIINPVLDEALRELDEFNKRAQAEEMEEGNGLVSENSKV
ncbi:MAG: hypothetical protein SFU99_23720 [Saprospiraceae bacterium]|nr:hypothetical protein [Saprospiraceae bacterium]